MIITRSPLRISLGGGGTDLPSYYEEHTGFLIAAAINKYVYITVHKTFVPELIIKYSKMERVHAVDEVSLAIAEGETLGLVGESGCGKSTLGKTVLKLIEPTAGTISWRGQRIDQLDSHAMRPYRREMQAVFQDPYASLNPRLRAADIVAEPIRNFERNTPAAVRGEACMLSVSLSGATPPGG